jgi:hypothetical protein
MNHYYAIELESDMYENVPDRLTNYLRSAAVDFDRESFYYFVAAYLGVFYLRKNFRNPETSNFLNIRRTSRGGIWYGHSGRVILIGETLFLTNAIVSRIFRILPPAAGTRSSINIF